MYIVSYVDRTLFNKGRLKMKELTKDNIDTVLARIGGSYNERRISLKGNSYEVNTHRYEGTFRIEDEKGKVVHLPEKLYNSYKH